MVLISPCFTPEFPMTSPPNGFGLPNDGAKGL